MDIQIDQIAIFVDDRDDKIEEISDIFDVSNWVEDEVESKGTLDGSVFHPFNYILGFNYELLEGGIEFEIIQEVDGKSYHNNLKPPCISHFGAHVEDLEEAEKYFAEKGYYIMQYNKTTQHTGTDQKYEYTFIDTTELLGYPLKLIRRR